MPTDHSTLSLIRMSQIMIPQRAVREQVEWTSPYKKLTSLQIATPLNKQWEYQLPGGHWSMPLTVRSLQPLGRI